MSRHVLCLSCLLGLVCACQKGPDILQLTVFELPVSADISAITALSDGTLLITGGRSWEQGVLASFSPVLSEWQIDTLTDRLLLHIGAIPSSGQAFAVGLGGDFFLRQPDEAWDFQRLPDWAQFRGGYFFPDGSGWLVSGNAWKNGRLTHLNSQLNRDTFFDFAEELDQVFFLDTLRGFAVGFGLVVQTLDGGKSWTETPLQGDWFVDLAFPDSEHGYMVGFAGTILKTTNAGEDWQTIRKGGSLWTPDWPIRAVYFRNAAEGMIVGDEGMIRWTTDGGKNWLKITGLPDNDWNDLRWQNGDWWVVGAASTMVKLSLP